MNNEGALISAVCKNGDIASVTSQIDDKMFESHADVWAGVQSYYRKYHSTPPIEVLEGRFNGFEGVDVKAPTAFYVDRVKEDYLNREIAKILISTSKSNDPPEKIIKGLQADVSRLGREAHIVRDLNITDYEDAQKYYEDLHNLALEKGGSPGIMSGFKSMDICYPTGMAGGHFIVMLGYSARGKAEDVNKVIPTPSGYRRFGDLKPGDFVFGSNGQPTKVSAIHPQSTISAMNVSFSDGTSGVFSPDHLWSFYAGRRGQKRGNLITMTTAEILERGLHHVGQPGSRGNWKVLLPIVNPVKYDSWEELPIDPYLMGAMLGDGSMCNDGFMAVLSGNDEEIIDIIKARVPEQKVTEYKPNGCRRWAFSKLQIRFKNIGLNVKSRDKFIPEEYLTSSIEDRYALLRGLMDTDGSVSPGRRAIFHTYSEGLANGVAEIVRSLGGIAEKHYKSDDEIYVAMVTPENPFGITRKSNSYHPREWFKAISKIEPITPQEMMCITVEAEDSLYVTSDYTLTHNTWLAGGLAVRAWQQGFKPMFVSLEMTPEAMRDRLYGLMGDGIFSMTELQTGALDIDNFRTWAKKSLVGQSDFAVVSTDGVGDMTVEAIQAKYDEHRPDLIIVDYLQLMGDGKKTGETERIRNVSRSLKGLAVRNNVPVIAISAVTMTDITAVDSPPMLEQVSYSKAIQYDADLALAVHKHDDTNIVEVVARKSRHGELFSFYLDVDLSRGVMRECFDANVGV